jgi:uncharacterized protein (DUF427 family)
MAQQMTDYIHATLGELRFQPTEKRVRAVRGAHTFVDSSRARLVWEPRRVVPSYAVPEDDIDATIRVDDAGDAEEHPVRLGEGGPPVLDPRTSFAVHSSAGEPVTLSAGAVDLTGAGFRLADPALAGYVVLDFGAFDTWLEEDDPIVGHPRDPFHRIDVRHSSRRVQVEVNGTVTADSSRPLLVFETHLPPRFYLPSDDVQLDLMTPSGTRTTCAYKGHASYWASEADGRHRDIAWSYESPLPDCQEIAGYVAFFDEHTDVILDGERRARPVTPWS